MQDNDLARLALGQRHWFVSFSEIDSAIEELLAQGEIEEDAEIIGQFEHLNLDGSSYYLSLDDSAKDVLRETLRQRPLLSTWDYIECAELDLSLGRIDRVSYQVHLSGASDCQTLWGD